MAEGYTERREEGRKRIKEGDRRRMVGMRESEYYNLRQETIQEKDKRTVREVCGRKTSYK